jgi:uroporphyrinogen-III synthase
VTALLPLQGRRIVVTRQPDQAEIVCARLAELGAVPLRFPTIDFAAVRDSDVDRALDALETYDWVIMTSANAVRFFLDLLGHGEAGAEGVRFAATGSKTAAELAHAGLQVAFVPQGFSGAVLAATLPDVAGARILIPRTAQGRRDLVDGLVARGARVDDVAIYRTAIAQPSAAEYAALVEGVDALTFTSPLTVENFARLVAHLSVHGAVVACIGPSTAEAAARAGYMPDVVAEEYTIDGLIEGLVAHFAGVSQ